MVSNVTLGNAINSSLLSIINTQRLIDRTTLRLASGLETNSAVENPKNFFSARALSDEASDLNRLIDNINQSIRTVEEASNGVTAITKNIQQANAVAQEAVDVLAAAGKDHYVIGNKDLSSYADLTSLSGITAGDIIQISARANDAIIYVPPSANIVINAGESINEIITEINNINLIVNQEVIDASLTEEGFFKLKNPNEYQLYFEFISTAGTDAANLALAEELGFSDVATLAPSGFVAFNEVQFTLNPSRVLTSFSLYNAATNQLANKNELISTLEGVNNTLLFFGLDSAADRFEIGVDEGTRESLLLDNTITIQDFINNINGNINLKDKLLAEFDEDTSKISITAIDPTISSIQTAVTSDNLYAAFFGFNSAAPIALAGQTDVDHIQIGAVDEASLAQLKSLEDDYDNILQSIDDITEDAQFNGINLLAGDSVTAYFNPDRTSSLTVEGTTFTSTQLGLTPADFTTTTSAQLAVDLTSSALDTVRSFGNTLSNQLSILEARRDFTDVTVNTLLAGAGDLVDADLNEEGANLLALQTRQSLAITALSIATLQRAAILSIFS